MDRREFNKRLLAAGLLPLVTSAVEGSPTEPAAKPVRTPDRTPEEKLEQFAMAYQPLLSLPPGLRFAFKNGSPLYRFMSLQPITDPRENVMPYWLEFQGDTREPAIYRTWTTNPNMLDYERRWHATKLTERHPISSLYGLTVQGDVVVGTLHATCTAWDLLISEKRTQDGYWVAGKLFLSVARDLTLDGVTLLQLPAHGTNLVLQPRFVRVDDFGLLAVHFEDFFWQRQLGYWAEFQEQLAMRRKVPPILQEACTHFDSRLALDFGTLCLLHQLQNYKQDA